MKSFIFVFILLCLTNLLPAQNKKIIKILDSNLYLIEDSTYIKLAGIDIPSRNNHNEKLKEIADEVYEYTYNNFLNHPLEIISIGEVNDYFNSKLVLINKKYLFSKKNYNEYFLERGFGKYINNSESINDSSFTAAENAAKENNNGIWKFENIENFGRLDETKSLTEIDSLNSELLLAPFKYDRNFTRILLELPIGIATGAISGFAVSGVLMLLSQGHGNELLGEFLLGFTSGYILGNALGVYLVARGGNKDLSFPGTLIASTLATGIWGGLIALNDMKDSTIDYFILAAPTVGAMIYANTLGYSPVERNTSSNFICNDSSFPHYKLYSHNSILMNIFRINL